MKHALLDLRFFGEGAQAEAEAQDASPNTEEQAVKAASLTPARSIGLEGEIGSIAPDAVFTKGNFSIAPGSLRSIVIDPLTLFPFFVRV